MSAEVLALFAAPASERHCCKVCGGPVRTDNKSGVCSRSLECLNAKAEFQRRARGVMPRGSKGRSICTIDGCEKIVHAYGLCQSHNQRKRLKGDPGAAEMRAWNHVKITVGDTFGWWTVLADCDRSETRLPCRCQCGERAGS